MNLTSKAQDFLKDNLTMEDALPTKMPVYVNSIAYLFGVSALSALGILLLSGVIMAVFGPIWYHVSSVGRFFNSIHFWGVQIFFGALVLHMISKFVMAAWRDGRQKTWIIGMLSFGLAVFVGLTGFLCQTNWDSQWIAVQSKDAMNAMGIGALFNTMNFSQVLGWHIFVLPVMLVVLVGIHLVLIRRDSPVRPLPLEKR